MRKAATELGWKMLGGMRAKAGAFARAISRIIALVSLTGSICVAPAFGEDPVLDPATAICGVPDPVVPACENTTEEIDVCGKKETLTRLCVYPFVTAAMAAEAGKYPVLKEEYERHNTCVSTDADCKALASEKGDEELQRKLEDDAATDIPGMIRFHLSVTGRSTDKEFTGIRDDAAIVAKKGFDRSIVAHQHLYRHLNDQKFHEDAEGVALANKGVVDREKEEVEKQAAALAEMKAKFLRDKDKLSELNTEGYETIARNRGLELSAVSCELKRMADRDRRIENRIAKVVVDGEELSKGKYGQGSPDAPSPNHHSDITGVSPDPVLQSGDPVLKVVAPPKTPVHLMPVENGPSELPIRPDMTGGSSPFPSSSEMVPSDDPLASFGPNPDQVGRTFRETASAPQGISEENDPLFERVHRQYRAREQSGSFRQSLVD